MPHVLFLGNQLGDVETLLGQRIPLGRDFLLSLLHALSLSLQSKTLILFLFNHRPFLFTNPVILCLSSPTKLFHSFSHPTFSLSKPQNLLPQMSISHPFKNHTHICLTSFLPDLFIIGFTFTKPNVFNRRLAATKSQL
ncbi:hypothetical protein Hdeb2414_s0017g00505651 [Helianthus debilis subsp. tardiflorus]